MTVVLEQTQQSSRIDAQQAVHEAAAKLHPGRAAALLGLMSTHDFVELVDSGLVERFHYDPRTGRDAIVHILAGDYKTGPDGALIPEGFHHAPSGDKLWPAGMTRALAEPRVSSVEPYASKTEIGGLPKRALVRDTRGEYRTVDQKSGMFPFGYDGYAVLKSIDIAARARDRNADVPSNRLGQSPRILSKSSAPLIDGRTPMPIQLVMRPAIGTEQEQIITAYPTDVRDKRPAFTEEQLHGYIYGDSGLAKGNSDE